MVNPINLSQLSRRNGLVFLLLVALLFPLNLFVVSQLDSFTVHLLLLAGENILLAASLNLVNGWTGQFSLGHAGFMAIGAYSAAVITSTLGAKFGVTPGTIGGEMLFFVATLCGGGLAAVFGYLVGLPSLRLKGDYLAVVTLGFSEIIRVLILNTDFIGGARGYIGIPTYSNFLWVSIWVLASLYILYRLHESRQGREWRAVQEDEVATEAMGISSTQTKVNAFVISSFIAGVAGSLFAHHLSYLNPSSFSILKTCECLIMVVLGGMGSLTGSVIAAVFITFLPEALRGVQDYTGIDLRMVIYSLTLIFVMLLRPQGLLGRWEIWHWVHRFKFIAKGQPS